MARPKKVIVQQSKKSKPIEYLFRADRVKAKEAEGWVKVSEPQGRKGDLVLMRKEV